MGIGFSELEEWRGDEVGERDRARKERPKLARDSFRREGERGKEETGGGSAVGASGRGMVTARLEKGL